MVGKWLEQLRICGWWILLFVATAAGIISGLAFAILAVISSPAIGTLLTRGKPTTELGDAVLAIYAFLTFAATGFIGAFSGTYGIARKKGYTPLAITGITMSVNILGFFVPTGGHALLPFYASVVTGLSLTVAFLTLRSTQAKS